MSVFWKVHGDLQFAVQNERVALLKRRRTWKHRRCSAKQRAIVLVILIVRRSAFENDLCRSYVDWHMMGTDKARSESDQSGEDLYRRHVPVRYIYVSQEVKTCD